MHNNDIVRIKIYDIIERRDRWIMDIIPTNLPTVTIIVFTDEVKYAKPFNYNAFYEFKHEYSEKYTIFYENIKKTKIHEYDDLSTNRPYIVSSVENEMEPVLRLMFESDLDANNALTELANKLVLNKLIVQGQSLDSILKNIDFIKNEAATTTKDYVVYKLNILNIGSKDNRLSKSLSNFEPRNFTIDGVHCASIEGFIQSLKFKDIDKQKEVCLTVGPIAKSLGNAATRDWKNDYILYWQGVEYDRRSDEYEKLITRMYDCVFDQNAEYKKLIKESIPYILIHSMGRSYFYQTTLTQKEFVNQIYRLQGRLEGI